MQFLGSVGIDLQLLVAQLVNFGLLLWILSKFLYAPIVARIEKEEAELRRAETLNEDLQNEKADFAKKRRAEIRRAREESERLIDEASRIAAEIERKAHRDAQTEMEHAVAAAQEEAEAEQRSITTGYAEKRRRTQAEELIARLQKDLPMDLRKQLQDLFRVRLLARVDELPTATIQVGARRAFQEVIHLVRRQGNATLTKEAESQLRGIIDRKLGPVVLTSALPVARPLLAEIGVAISDRFGLPFPVEVRSSQDAKLLAGFCLEVWGALLEEDLAHELTYARPNT